MYRKLLNTIHKNRIKQFKILKLKNFFKFVSIIIVYLSVMHFVEAAGMTEFSKISAWVQDNLQGTLGKAVSAIALAIAVCQVGFGNPRMTVIAPIVIMLGLIWVAMPLINTIFK